MAMADAMTAAFGRSAVWLVSAAIGLLIAEVYYVQPELASIVPTLRISDMAVGLMSAMTQQGAAGDDLPLRCKVRLALGYLTGLVAQARRPPAAERGRLRPARPGVRVSATRCESRRRLERRLPSWSAKADHPRLCQRQHCKALMAGLRRP